jgi:hypothetical protein
MQTSTLTFVTPYFDNNLQDIVTKHPYKCSNGILLLASTSSSLTLVTILLPLYLQISIRKTPCFSLHLGGFLGVQHEPQVKELENCVDAKGSCFCGRRRWQVYINIKCQSSL